MPRVHSKIKSNRGKYRKCGRCGEEIKPGEQYFSWDFRYGGTQFRCYRHYPRPSELTQSKLGQVYAAQEAFQDGGPYETIEDLKDAVEQVAEEARAVADEYREAAEAMGAAGYENEERADELEAWADELEGFDPEEADFDEDVTDEEREQAQQDALESAQSEAEELVGNCPL